MVDIGLQIIGGLVAKLCPTLVTMEWGAIAFSLTGGTVLKNSPANAGGTRDAGSISGSGRSPGRGNGNPLQYSCLKNSVDRGALWATVHWVTESWTQLSTHTHTPLELQACQGLPYTFQMLSSS